MLKKLVLFCAGLFLAGVVFGVTDPGAPVDRIDDAGTTIMSDGGGSIPTDPAHAMEEAVNIYIHVILRQPDGPPPPEDVYILSTDCTDGSQQVALKSSQTPAYCGGIRFNVWRKRNWPMFYSSDLVVDSHRIGSTAAITFYDYFTDVFWAISPSSKGVCDTIANYYYVFTTVDSNTAGLSESPYPSNCVAEFDQKVRKGNGGALNIVSLPVAHDRFYNSARAIGDSTVGADVIRKWNFSTQSWGIAASRNPITGTWLVGAAGDALPTGSVFAINYGRAGFDSTLFRTFAPGYIAEDVVHNIRISDLVGGSTTGFYWLMLPMRYTHELDQGPTYPTPLRCNHVADDISPDGSLLADIRTWNNRTQARVIAASYNVVTGNWISGGTINTLALPGKPIALNVKADITWPPAR